MTYEEFRKAYKPIRCFDAYSSEQRANHAASHRLGFRQRQAVGTSYYVHPLMMDRAFPTAKAAATAAYQNHAGQTIFVRTGSK